MAIKIKQLTINSSVLSNEGQSRESSTIREGSDQHSSPDTYQHLEEIKADILAECQRLIKHSLQFNRER
jgi:hypothetical protein